MVPLVVVVVVVGVVVVVVSLVVVVAEVVAILVVVGFVVVSILELQSFANCCECSLSRNQRKKIKKRDHHSSSQGHEYTSSNMQIAKLLKAFYIPLLESHLCRYS